MTREDVIKYITDMLWNNGIGSKGGALNVATTIVDNLIKAGVLTVVSA